MTLRKGNQFVLHNMRLSFKKGESILSATEIRGNGRGRRREKEDQEQSSHKQDTVRQECQVLGGGWVAERSQGQTKRRKLKNVLSSAGK